MTGSPTERDDTVRGTLLAPAALAASTTVLLAALVALGDGVLAAPPAEPEALRAWASSGDPLLHAAAIGRLAAIASGAWVLVTTVLGLAARLVGSARGVAISDRWSPAIVRRCIQQVGAASLVGTLTVAAPAGVAAAAEAPVTTVREVSTAADTAQVATMTWEPHAPMTEDATTSSSATSTTAPPTSGPPEASAAVLPPPAPAARPVPLGAATSSEQTETAGASPSSPDESAHDDPAPSPAPAAGASTATAGGERPGPTDAVSVVDPQAGSASTSVTVRPGDHLWGIAAATVAARSGADPSAHDVATYWLELIDRNAERFVEPGNPDLIVPGQVLVLP